jgi:hypothetical protein
VFCKGRGVYLRDSICKKAGSGQHVWSSFYSSSSGISISQWYLTSCGAQSEIEQQNTTGEFNCSSDLLSFEL